MCVIDKIQSATDFRALWRSISAQRRNGIPVRCCFFCDCSYKATSHEELFAHTSLCAHPAIIVQWGDAVVLMPQRELQALNYEYKALEADETFALQLWLIAYKILKLPVCPLEVLKAKFIEVAGWYGLVCAQAERLWKFGVMNNFVAAAAATVG